MEFQKQWKEAEAVIRRIENPETIEVMSTQELRVILKSLKHENVLYLEDFGYRPSLLKFVGLMLRGEKDGGTTEKWNDYFWKINDVRLDDQKIAVVLEQTLQQVERLDEKVQKQISKISEQLLKCTACDEKEVSILYLPCGHVILCKECFERKSNKICQICKSLIKEWHHLYL